MRQPIAESRAAGCADGCRVMNVAIVILDQGQALLDAVSSVIYSPKVPSGFNALIGGHYRHCLGLLFQFQSALDRGVVDLGFSPNRFFA